jgi:hypothetical protein
MNVCSSHDQMRYEIYHPRNRNVSTILNQCLVLHKSQLQGLVLCSACCTRGLGQIKGFGPVHGLFIKELYQLGLSHSLKSFKWNSQSWSTAAAKINSALFTHRKNEVFCCPISSCSVPCWADKYHWLKKGGLKHQKYDKWWFVAGYCNSGKWW